MEMLNTVIIGTVSTIPLRVKATDSLKLVNEKTVVVGKVNPGLTDGWAFSAELDGKHCQWDKNGHCITYNGYPELSVVGIAVPKRTVEPEVVTKGETEVHQHKASSYEKLAAMFDSTKNKAKIPSIGEDVLSYGRVTTHTEQGDVTITIMEGRVVVLENNKLAVVDYFSGYPEYVICGHTIDKGIALRWDSNLNCTSGRPGDRIILTIDSAYYIGNRNIGIIVPGTVVKLQNGSNATIDTVTCIPGSPVVITGSLSDNSMKLKWNHQGRCTSHNDADHGIASVVMRGFRKLTSMNKGAETKSQDGVRYRIYHQLTDIDYLRLVKMNSGCEFHIDITAGSIVTLKNGKLSVIRSTTNYGDQLTYGYIPGSDIIPVWDEYLRHVSGKDEYEITGVRDDAYYIFNDDIGLVMEGTTLELKNGTLVNVDSINCTFGKPTVIRGSRSNDIMTIEWDYTGKCTDSDLIGYDIKGVVSHVFCKALPEFEDLTDIVNRIKGGKLSIHATIEAEKLKPKPSVLPPDKLDLKMGDQVMLTTGSVAIVSRVPDVKLSQFSYDFIALPDGKQYELDIRPEHQDNNKVGVTKVLCGPERINEYYFDFNKLKPGDSYSYIAHGKVNTKVYQDDAIDRINKSSPLVFDTRFLATWWLTEIQRALNKAGDKIREELTGNKYELYELPVVSPNSKARYKIRALRDIPSIGVSKGDMGGIVESEYSLSQSGDCWVFEGGFVIDDAQVSEDAIVKSGGCVSERARVTGKAVICDGVTVNRNAYVGGTAVIQHGTIGKSAVVTKPYDYLFVDDANGRGVSCTLYNANRGTGITIGKYSTGVWQSLCADKEAMQLISHEQLLKLAKMYDDIRPGYLPCTSR